MNIKQQKTQIKTEHSTLNAQLSTFKEKTPEFDVLIVDDDPANCLLLRKILEHKGSRVESAERLEDILVRLDQYIPPVLILDLFMGYASGFDILKELQLKYDLADTLVIIYTAQPINYSERERYEKEYHCRILEKLLDQDKLFSMIELKLSVTVH